jgi:hypothetical protein
MARPSTIRESNVRVQDMIESRLGDLKKMPFAELSLLAPYQGERIRHGRKAFSVAVWKDVVGDNQLRIVVQVYRYWLLGIGRMEAHGFIVDNIGNVRMLARRELYEFI